MTQRHQSKRQEAKERNRRIKDLYFLIQWLDNEDTMYDALPARDIVVPEGHDTLKLLPGEECQAYFANQLYSARVVAVGKYTEIKQEQAQKEKEAEALDDDLGPAHFESAIGSTDNGQVCVGDQAKEGSRGKEEDQSKEEGRNKEGQTRVEKGSQSKKGEQTKQKDDGQDKEKRGSLAKKSKRTGDSNKNDNNGKEMRGQTLVSPTKRSQGKQALKESPTKPKQANVKEPPERKVVKSPHKRPIICTDSSSESDEEPATPPISKKARLQSVTPKRKGKDRSTVNVDSQKLSDSEEEGGSSTWQASSSLEAKRAFNMAEHELFKNMLGLSPGVSSTTLTAEVTKLKEKMRLLEKSQISLKRKVSEQAMELNQLRRFTSPDLSSASELTPEISYAPPQGPAHLRFSKDRSPPVHTLFQHKQEDETPVRKNEFLKGVDSIKLAHAKLQKDAGSAALKLMDCVFTTAEMVNGNPSGMTKSKDPLRQRTIRPLDSAKMKYIDDFLNEKWGTTTADKNVRKRMTQKCTDYFSDSRYKHLRLT